MARGLCSGKYYALQVNNTVTVFGMGLHPTTGFKTYFEPYRMPNTFGLYCESPTGNVLKVFTPFATTIQYNSTVVVDKVAIIDSNGQHSEPVERVLDNAIFHRAEGDAQGSLSAHEQPSHGNMVHRWETTGYSNTFQLHEALQNAIGSLPASEPSHPDALLDIRIVSIGAEVGGMAGLNRLVVKAVATVT
jgi:hypothetical protein